MSDLGSSNDGSSQPTVVSSPEAITAPTHQLERLNHCHHAIIECALAGMTRNEIATEFGRSPEGVGLILNSPLAQQEMARRREQQRRTNDTSTAAVLSRAKQLMEENSVKAVEKVVQHISSPDDATSLKASNSLLDRVFGSGPKKDGEGTGVTFQLGPDALKTLAEAMSQHQDRVEGKGTKSILSRVLPGEDQSNSDRGEVTKLSA